MRVLVFDDEPQHFTWLEDLVESLGGTVSVRDRIEDAITDLEDCPDFIVSDICAGGRCKMPDVDPRWSGVDFIKEARRCLPDTLIVAYTGIWDPELTDILDTFDAYYINKDPTTLRDMIKDYHAQT